MKHKALSHNTEKGQALVEHALILVLVVVVVVIALTLLGSSIGKAYTDMVTSLGGVSGPTQATATPTAVPTAVPTATPTWVFCSDEYQYCSFRGIKQVQYGANGVYTERTLTDGTWCKNSVFGDPLVGVLKHCYIR
jgi:Flp pilus assembly pilin Flp